MLWGVVRGSLDTKVGVDVLRFSTMLFLRLFRPASQGARRGHMQYTLFRTRKA
jgi:hypothetical protein